MDHNSKKGRDQKEKNKGDDRTAGEKPEKSRGYIKQRR